MNEQKSMSKSLALLVLGLLVDEPEGEQLHLKTELSEPPMNALAIVTPPPPVMKNGVCLSEMKRGNVPSNVSRLQCELCGKECRSPGEKVIHMRSHTGEQRNVDSFNPREKSQSKHLVYI
jgi:hypothetical protein